MKLYNENCLDVFKSIKDNSIDLICTDPPYKITSRGCSGGTGGMLKSKISMEGKIFEENDIHIKDYIAEFCRVLKDGSHCYIMTNNKNLSEFLNVIEGSGLKIYKTLIWKKNSPICNQWYMDSHEYIIFCRKGKAIKIHNAGCKSVLEYDNPRNKIHPTEKPVGLLQELIGNSTKENDVVLDPFMGSGSCGVACKNLKRDFIGIELDKKYFGIAEKRLDKVSKELF